MTETMRVLEWAPSYGIELLTARLPTDDEKAKYADWFKPVMLVGVPDTRTELKHFTWADLKTVFGDRRSTHSFCGCNNQVWILQPGDEEKILAIDADRKAAKQAKIDADQKAKEDHVINIAKTARDTGTDQVLSAYLGECDGSVEECSSDWIRVMIRPDGSTYQTRTHTY